MRRTLATFSLVAPLLLAGCGGGGGGGGGAETTPTAATAETAASPATTTTPASASFPAGSAYRSYAAAARQQHFSLSPFGYCSGDATLTETAPVAATFEGGTAMRRTVTWVMHFTNCIPETLTTVTSVFQDADNAAIGESRAGVRYAVLDRPLAFPALVKVGDTGALATGSIYTDSTKKDQLGSIEYSFVAKADDRADAILVELTARATGSLGQLLFIDGKTYRVTASGAMDLISALQTETGRRLVFSAE